MSSKALGNVFKLHDEINVKDPAYGAKGDGVTDDTVAIQAALDAAVGKSLYIPPGTYQVTSELTYDTTEGPLRIHGEGPNSVLRAAGATNKCLHITGTAGVTGNHLLVEKLGFSANGSGVSAALLHLDGIACWWVRDCDFNAQAKASYAIRCTAAQQGEIGASRFFTIKGILLEPDAPDLIHSNGIEIHGNTMFCSTTNIEVDRIDSGFIHSNHLTTAPISIDVLAPGFGWPVIARNHIESHTTAGVRTNGVVVVIDSNNFFHGSAGVDIVLTGTQIGSIVCNNLLSGSLNFGASVENVKFFGNLLTNTGTLTLNDVRRQAWGNSAIANAGTFGDTGNSLLDKLAITSRATVAGHILTLTPNTNVGGSWGMRITGSGAAQDIYVQLNDYTLNGTTSGGSMTVKDGVAGTMRARFNFFGVAGNPMVIATGNVAAVGAGEIGYSAQTQTTVGAAGGASALPATPTGYILVSVAGANKKIPYYEP